MNKKQISERKNDSTEDISELVEMNLDREKMEEKIKEKSFEKSLDKNSLLFNDFTERVLNGLTTLYAIVSRMNEEDDLFFIYKGVRGIMLHVKYHDWKRYEEYNQALEVRVSSERDWIHLKFFPERAGFLKKKKTGRHLIRICNEESTIGYKPKKETYDMATGIEELKRREEKRYRALVKEELENYGKKTADLKKYESLIEVLKDLPKYVKKVYKNENQDLNHILENLDKEH